MIMEKMKPHQVNDPTIEQEQSSNVSLQKILLDIRKINEKIEEKDTEIGDLKIKLRDAHVLIDELYGRISTLEEKIDLQQQGNKQNDSPTSESSPALPQEKTLILGDGNLCRIVSSDLKNNCNIRTIDGANIDVINCWVTEKLNRNPTKCILYCGMEDVLDGQSPNVILDNMGALIGSLKERNESMNIYVCELVPALKAEENISLVKAFNNKLIEWSYDNNINIIKTYFITIFRL